MYLQAKLFLGDGERSGPLLREAHEIATQLIAKLAALGSADETPALKRESAQAQLR